MSEARNHETEVEAVARAIKDELPYVKDGRARRVAERAIAARARAAALDAVRRSPQGEDHEAGIEAAHEVLYRIYGDGERTRNTVRRAIAAYLSRCPSPERNTEKLYGLLAEFVNDNDDCEYDHNDLCQAHHLHERPCPHERAKEWLAEFSTTRSTDV